MTDSPSDPSAFRFEQGSDAVLHGVVHPASRRGPRPTVVICHGFKGFMDWGFFPPLAELLAARGFTVVRFNYSGIGQLPGEDRVSDLDAFRHNSHRRELNETLAVLDALGREIAPGRVDRARIGLVGHSRGGGAAILAAAHDETGDTLRALVTWAAVATFDRYPAEVKKRWRDDGELVIANGRTGQQLPLGLALLDDIEQHTVPGGVLDLEAAAGRVRTPWLIIHGDADETVQLEDAQRLNRQATGPHELLVIPGGGHTFGSGHPFSGPTPPLVETFNATQTFLRRHLA